jgi:hypothetical protein
MTSWYNSYRLIIKSLKSNEFHYFDLKQLDQFRDIQIHCVYILGINKGLILLEIIVDFPRKYVVCNPATNQLIELPQIGCTQSRHTSDLVVDLQSNTYKIFLLDYATEDYLMFYVYNSLTNTWQPLESFSKFRSNFQFEFFNSHVLFFKEKLYSIFKTKINGLMMVVYDQVSDTWNKLDIKFLTNKSFSGRFVVANDRLFFVQLIYKNEDDWLYKSISVIEVNMQGSASFPIAYIERPQHRQHILQMTNDHIYGVGNKIIMSYYIRNFDILYDVCSHKETEKFVDCNLQSKHIYSYHSLKYSLASPQCKATSCGD